MLYMQLIFVLICFSLGGALSSSVQDLFLALYSVITPFGLRGPTICGLETICGVWG